MFGNINLFSLQSTCYISLRKLAEWEKSPNILTSSLLALLSSLQVNKIPDTIPVHSTHQLDDEILYIIDHVLYATQQTRSAL